MGRHGDHAPGGIRRRRGDGTAGGVALPLIVAAVVCLLATSGVWLFSGGDKGHKNDKTPIGLNVPTTLAPEPEPTATADADPTGSPEPSASASASKNPTKAPTSAKPTTKPPATTTSAPPPRPTEAKAADMQVAVVANNRRLVITNPTDLPLTTWTLTVSLPSDRDNEFYRWVSSDATVSLDRNRTVATATARGPLPPGGVVTINLGIYSDGGGTAACSFSGTSCSFTFR